MGSRPSVCGHDVSGSRSSYLIGKWEDGVEAPGHWVPTSHPPTGVTQGVLARSSLSVKSARDCAVFLHFPSLWQAGGKENSSHALPGEAFSKGRGQTTPLIHCCLEKMCCLPICRLRCLFLMVLLFYRGIAVEMLGALGSFGMRIMEIL